MALQPVDRIIHRREFQCVKLIQFEAIIIRFATGVLAERMMIMATTLVGIGRLSLPALPETLDLLLLAVPDTTRGERYRP